jgi:hypothetical protein
VASIQLNSDGTVHSNDGVSISKAINTPGEVLPDSQRHNINIATKAGGLFTFNSATGVSTHRDNSTSVQLRAPDGKVQIGAYRTDAATVENLKVMAPEMFVPEEEKLAEAAAAEADAAAAEAERASMNAHPDSFVEESHTQFTNVVPAQLQTELLVQMHRDGVPSEGTLNRVAESLGVSVDEAVTRLNAMSAGVQAQLSVLAKARGVNPERFANWARDNHRGESLRAMQGHVQGRQLLSWDTLIAEFKARGQHDPLR